MFITIFIAPQRYGSCENPPLHQIRLPSLNFSPWEKSGGKTEENGAERISTYALKGRVTLNKDFDPSPNSGVVIVNRQDSRLRFVTTQKGNAQAARVADQRLVKNTVIVPSSRIGVAGNGKTYSALTVALFGLAIRVFDATLFLIHLIAARANTLPTARIVAPPGISKGTEVALAKILPLGKLEIIVLEELLPPNNIRRAGILLVCNKRELPVLSVVSPNVLIAIAGVFAGVSVWVVVPLVKLIVKSVTSLLLNA